MTQYCYHRRAFCGAFLLRAEERDTACVFSTKVTRRQRRERSLIRLRESRRAGTPMMTPKKLVVVTPHPDDETLGCGGTIARFADLGTEVSVLVVSGHLPPLYEREVFEICRKEAEAAFQIMGVTNSEFLAIPATLVRDMPVAKLNGQI